MIRRTVVLEAEARRDFVRIYEWIAEHASPAIALRYTRRLRAYLGEFATASERGTLHDDIRPGMRVVGFERRVTVVFAVAGSDVRILRPFYAGQDWTRAFSDDDQG